ncbi:hypothetical protein RO3G_00478 [Rhizopus delemar RA 99-880]|uniref:Uncharacterized protein n=1 Tax=Rhizopus delemar (strain RA 99-880 / ATCC MYA-4621 / FGSC 9543 / NRRL 43880) TaxID=246409 RepID=I1BHU4_RHIO9|nr:hypothetical protein RO3G_00478 [Rhizopus delemar RA 99-880]|eukprot:EIE75774.1 hypothetical protein RO3G_00478 [Rhizopus delemar RA 99-880]
MSSNNFHPEQLLAKIKRLQQLLNQQQQSSGSATLEPNITTDMNTDE